MSRPRYRHEPKHCTCRGGSLGPSTHHGAAHLDGQCPHSTLADDAGGYARRRAAIDAVHAAQDARRTARQALRAQRRGAPVARIVL